MKSYHQVALMLIVATLSLNTFSVSAASQNKNLKLKQVAKKISVKKAAPMPIIAGDQALCVDLSRRAYSDKVNYYHQLKGRFPSMKPAQRLSLAKRLPVVINSSADGKAYRLIKHNQLLGKKLSIKRQKNFAAQLHREEQFVSALYQILKRDGGDYLSSCQQHLKQQRVKCQAYYGKGFKKYQQCLGAGIQLSHPRVKGMMPFVAFKYAPANNLKPRMVASQP